jgi:hypothetical protein
LKKKKINSSIIPVVSTQLKQLPKGLLQYKVEKENLVVPSSFSASADWTRIQMSDILK